MPSNKMFMSPRSDLTIRNLTAEQVEKISNAAVDIVGGVVQFSESAIYESEDTSRQIPLPPSKQCEYALSHSHHVWYHDDQAYVCHGKLIHG